MKKYKSILASIFLTGIFLFLLLNYVDINEIFKVIGLIKVKIFLLGLILYLIRIVLLSLRMSFAHNDSLEFMNFIPIILISNFFNNVLPSRSGELSFLYYLKKIGLSLSEALSILLTVRFFDLITILILLLGVTTLLFPIMRAINIISILILALLILLFLSHLFLKNKFNFIIEMAQNFIDVKIINQLLDKIKNSIELIKNQQKKDLLYIFIISIITSLMRPFIIYIVLSSLPIKITFLQILFISLITLTTTILPIQGFGNFGTYESVWTGAAVLSGYDLETAILTGFIAHVIGVSYILISGFLGLATFRKQHSISEVKL